MGKIIKLNRKQIETCKIKEYHGIESYWDINSSVNYCINNNKSSHYNSISSVKNRLKLLLLIIAIITFSSNSTFAQNSEMSKKEIRKQRRAEEQKQQQILLASKISERNFTFIADEILSTGKARYSNIKLRSLWTVAVTFNRFRCNLPIYGATSFGGQPSLKSGMTIFTDDYKMSIENLKDGVINVKIEAKDDTSSTQYYFDFIIPADGKHATLTVSSNFKSPVRYSGRIDVR